MGTILDEFNEMKIRIAKGDGGKSAHVVYHDEERKRKRENPTQSTRIVLDTYSPEAWKEFHAEKDRYFSIAVNVHIAISLMIRALREKSDTQIKAWIQEGDTPAAPEEPEWMR